MLDLPATAVLDVQLRLVAAGQKDQPEQDGEPSELQTLGYPADDEQDAEDERQRCDPRARIHPGDVVERIADLFGPDGDEAEERVRLLAGESLVRQDEDELQVDEDVRDEEFSDRAHDLVVGEDHAAWQSLGCRECFSHYPSPSWYASALTLLQPVKQAPTPRLGPRRVHARVEGHEVAVAGHLDQVRRELGWAAEEPRGVDELLDDVAGMAAPQAEVLLAVVREDLAHRLGLVVDALARADALEDLVVLLDRRSLDPDLVTDAPEERLVDEVGRVEVRREDDEHVERDLDLLTGVQREVVDALLERHDPSVEEVLGRDPLPAEVVDHEDPAVRLHLERRLVELRHLVVDEVERLERELPAGHHDRPLRNDPAVIEAQPLGDDRVEGDAVIHLVVDLHDLLVDLDRVRQHDVALHERREDLGDRRLAVAWRPEQEDRLPRVHRGTKLGEGLARDDHVRERAHEVVLGDVKVRDGLQLHRLHVGREWDRRLPDVLAAGKRLLSLLRSAIDDDELVVRRREPRTAANLDESLVLEEIHDPLGDIRDRQTKGRADLGHRHLTPQVKRLEREIRQKAERESGLLDGLWLRWKRDLRGCGLCAHRRRRPRLRRRLVHVAPSLTANPCRRS